MQPVKEAIKAGREITHLYVSAQRRRLLEELDIKALGIEHTLMHDPEFFDQRFPKGHQGVAAQMHTQATLSLDELLELGSQSTGPQFYILLDEVEDPRNFGAILRSAEAAGVTGVVVQAHRQAALGPEARKASAGASEHLAICTVPNIKNAMDQMDEMGITLVGAEASSEQGMWDMKLRLPMALVIGSEEKGLRQVVKKRCHHLVGIPLMGKVSSLNASVSAAVLMYEILRQNRT